MTHNSCVVSSESMALSLAHKFFSVPGPLPHFFPKEHVSNFHPFTPLLSSDPFLLGTLKSTDKSLNFLHLSMKT